MTEKSQLLQEFAQTKQEVIQMGKDIESCFTTLIEQIREEFDHFSKGMEKALIGLQKAVTGTVDEIDEEISDTPKKSPEKSITNPLFFV